MIPANSKETGFSSLMQEQTCQIFSLAEIQSATQNFDEALVIGRGGFGKVYKCSIKKRSKDLCAVKRLNSISNQGAREFWAEVQMLSKLRHCNLVSLIGFSNDGPEMVLVYEYMPNGTLEDRLHKSSTPLSWSQRLKICLGAARGLDYLHSGTGTQHGVIHRDVKSSNILLDANFAARISDFGLAKVGPINQIITHVSTGVKGTFGYMDPCYFVTGKLTRKSDVYAFGVVLLEVVCGRPAVDPTLDEEQWGLAAWALDCMKKGKLGQIIDPRLKGQVSANCLKEFARIASRCLHDHPKQRPTMAEVVVKLEFILSFQDRMDERPFADRVWLFFSANFNNLKRGRPVASSGKQTDAVVAESRLKIFTFAELVSATVYFKYKVGTSDLETVYKGWIDERTYAPTEFGVGMPILVRTKHLEKGLQLDLNYLEEFDHPNLVKLLGYCLHEYELLCVQECSPNGSLYRLLFREQGMNALPWILRIKIAIGAAQGLSFLHKTKKQATYSQFKTSVILVDADFTAKLSYFELEKFWLAKDEYSFHNDAFYAAPEWFAYQAARLDDRASCFDTGYFCLKSEVYAFGVVLLEMLTGQKVYDVNRPQGKQNLVKWATPLLENKENLEIYIDPELKHEYPPERTFNMALLVSKCLRPIPEKRDNFMNLKLEAKEREGSSQALSH